MDDLSSEEITRRDMLRKLGLLGLGCLGLGVASDLYARPVGDGGTGQVMTAVARDASIA
jgi:hypothetical protein